MAIRLPENLVPENTPLAWMIDSWVGGGILEYENVEPAAYIHQVRFDASNAGPYLKVTSTVWLANEPAGVVDKEAPGQVTFDQLTKNELWMEHTGYIRVNPQSKQREDGSYEIEAMLASPVGVAHAWVGLINGPRLQMITDSIMRSGSGAAIDAVKVMAGSVASDLFYAVDMAGFGAPMRSYMAGRLSRTFDGSVDPVSEDKDLA
ncbi:FABP family protein [Arcanobacterium pinnipediorum]|uniref:FABP family protein n=1 Tax=Arcanobacterium pinnipediorum TaxID=1503041 RepID=A0ABY5AK72_9ACTO|nr:FABP family protein [Arcanobacterium pinnipediorum]USR79598.1 FABP family protein [Arcanobacterium pinnipediorum]